MSWGRSNFRQGAPAWSSGLRRCSAQKPAPCPVVVIDEDDDGGGSDSEIIILDGAAGKASFGRQAKKGEGSSGNVINLDDDDEEEVSPGDKAGPSSAGGAGSTAAKTTPGRSSAAAKTPGRASGTNRYGLDCTSDYSESDVSEAEDTESESDEDSTSDCEIMDREMWETATSSRKKMPSGACKSNEGMATASTSSSGSDTRPKENAEGVFGPEYHLNDDILRFFQDAYPEHCPSTANDGSAGFNWNGNKHFSDAWKGEQSSTPGAKGGHYSSTAPDAKDCSNANVSDGKETECGHGDAKDSRAECHLKEDVSQYFSHADEEGTQNTTGAAKDDCDPSSGQNAMEPNGRVPSREGSDACESSTLDSNAPHNAETTDFHNGDVPEKASGGIQTPNLDQTFVDTFVSAKRVFPASCSPDRKYGVPLMYASTPERMDERIPEGICLSKDQSSLDVHNVASGSCSLSQKDLVDDPKGLGQFTLVQESSNFQDGLIGEREKHKETEEFKRAAEEEWASRQRQLQIQAEEAQKLRKRKKAQALRLLEMEKKQKQRLEEVRESQKKNKEEIQLKEHYRSVVRKELEDTERRYKDTLSILRVLGIPVEGREVRAALKLAQVKFHPDRVSRGDIYQQVKAEETFKFISRLKEKLPHLPK